MYQNFPIISVSHIQTEMLLITTESDYICLSQAMKYVLHFLSLMKNLWELYKTVHNKLVVYKLLAVPKI